MPFSLRILSWETAPELAGGEVFDWAQQHGVHLLGVLPQQKASRVKLLRARAASEKRVGQRYRFETSDEQNLLDRYWTVSLSFSNFFVPFRKRCLSGDAVGSYDSPMTPYRRLHTLGSTEVRSRTEQSMSALDPVMLRRQMHGLQRVLLNNL
ncbi:hypothetical protein GCM10009771_15490 [Nesterenkonia flava]